MTHTLIKVKPLTIICNEKGQQCFQFEDAGQLAEVMLAPFQIGQSLPEYIYLVKHLADDGSIGYNQSKYELLRQLYGVEGKVTLTVHSITKENDMSMYKLYLKDCYAFVHIYLCRSNGKQLRRGRRLNFRYKLMRLGDMDGYLALSCLDQLDEEGFLDPTQFINSCRHADTVKACFDHLQQHWSDATVHKLETQLKQQNNLWVMTFVNHLKHKLGQYARSNRYEKLYQYATAYEAVERRIVADDRYLTAFKSEKREEMRNRIENEISNAWTTRVAINIRKRQRIDQYITYIQHKIQQGISLQPKEIRLMVELHNMDNTLANRLIDTIARILLNDREPLEQAKGPILCLHSIMDNYINGHINEINAELHIKDNPAEEQTFLHIIQLLGIQIMLLDPEESRAVVRLKTAQLCRLISYLLDDIKATLMVKKAIALLSAQVKPSFTLADLEQTNINELADKLLSIPLTPEEEPLQFLGAGSIIFYQGKIYITNQQQFVSYANRNEGSVLHSLLDGLINLRTQNDPSALKDTFGLLGTGWTKVYEPVRNEYKEVQCPLVLGEYPISFNHINKEKSNRAIFYVKDTQGNAYKAMMYPNGLYSVPCDTMEDIFQFGDKFYGTVIKVGAGGAIVSIIQSMYTFCNQRVSTGDCYIAKCLEIKEDEAILYGENGTLCKAPYTEGIKPGHYYIVTVTEMPPKSAKYVPVRKLKVSAFTFDPLTVNREQIRNYISTHSADTGERVARIYATELMYLLDRMALLTKDTSTKFYYYQYLKLTSCIVRTKMSYIYQALCGVIKERIIHPQNPNWSVTAEDLKTYPRLAGEMSQ